MTRKLLLFYNSGDGIAGRLVRAFNSYSKTVEVHTLTLEEFCYHSRIIHRFPASTGAAGSLFSRNGKSVPIEDADILFNRIRFSLPGIFLHQKDTLYASQEMLALFVSMMHSCRGKKINCSPAFLYSNYSVNSILLHHYCLSNKLPVHSSSMIPGESLNQSLPVPTERLLFCIDSWYRLTDTSMEKQLTKIMIDLDCSFGELYFSEGKIISYNPFPTFITDDETDFIRSKIASLIVSDNP